MDSSHVSLVAVLMRAEAFDPLRAERGISLGLAFASFAKV
jgi:proliferating cell nuclear antigen